MFEFLFKTKESTTKPTPTPFIPSNIIQPINNECFIDVVLSVRFKNNDFFINDDKVNKISIKEEGGIIPPSSLNEILTKCPIPKLKLISKQNNLYEFLLPENNNIILIFETAQKVSGGSKKYYLTKEKVNILYKKKKITRSIYIDSKKNKFIKINDSYKNLNKCKIIK